MSSSTTAQTGTRRLTRLPTQRHMIGGSTTDRAPDPHPGCAGRSGAQTAFPELSVVVQWWSKALHLAINLVSAWGRRVPTVERWLVTGDVYARGYLRSFRLLMVTVTYIHYSF